MNEALIYIAAIVSIAAVIAFFNLCINISKLRKTAKYHLQLKKKQYLENGGKMTDEQIKAIDNL